MERRGHAAVLLDDGELLVVGGYLYDDPSGSPHRVERYNPATALWSVFSDAPGYHSFEDHGVLLADGRVLVLGLEAGEVHDPATDTWAGLPVNSGVFVSNTSVTQLADGDVLAAGAAMDTNNWSTAVRLDGATLEVEAASDLNLARGGHSATLLADGRVLIAGGRRFVDELEQFATLADAEIYDPASDQWHVVTPMLDARAGHRAATLPDGRVLVTGGFGLATTEIYDPTSDSWTPGAAMIDARGGHSLTKLPSGWIVAVGGDGSSGVQGSAEAYDPTTDSWFALASLTQPRMDHTATYVPDHGLLVVGGGSGRVFHTGLSTAELYSLGTIAAGEVCVMPDECASGSCDAGVCVEDEDGPGKGKGKGKGEGEPGGGCPFDAEQPLEGGALLLGPLLLLWRRKRETSDR